MIPAASVSAIVMRRLAVASTPPDFSPMSQKYTGGSNFGATVEFRLVG